MKMSLFTPVRRALSPRRWLRMPVLFGAVVALILGLGAGSAFAFFTSTGHGSGAATTGTAQSVTVVAESGGTTVNSDLQPGAMADLLVEIDNPNTYPLTLTNISENGTTVTPVGGSGCSSANSGVSVPTQSSLNITVPSGTTVVHISNGAAMSNSSATACQGLSFQIPVLVSVQKG